jgi:predicted Zn-dependent protease
MPLNNSSMNKIVTCLILLLCTISGCAVNPVTGDNDFALVSESKEIKQGRSYHGSILSQYGVYDDPDLQAYVNRIGQKLASKSHRSHLKFTFTVLDSPDINAFALPGGYIYITRGIMAYLGSEAELAGVLGHEIGHVTARHSVRQQSGQVAASVLSVLIAATTGSSGLGNASQQLTTGLVRGYGREHELEADRLGAEYLHNSSYDPESMLEVIGVLKDQEVYEKALAKKEKREASIYHGVYSTHPKNDDRLKTVVRAAKKLSTQTYQDNNQSLYYRHIDGMIWGPSPRQGVVNGNVFSHPDLAFAIELPVDWQVRNREAFLLATNPAIKALVQIGVVSLGKDESPVALLKRLTGNKELKVQKLGFGVTANTRVKPKNGDYQPARISAIQLENRQVLTFMGTAIKEKFAESDPYFSAIVTSFTKLTLDQIDAIQVPRLEIIEKQSGHDFSSLAQSSAIGYEAENILRLLNRAFPNGDITHIKNIKIITRD